MDNRDREFARLWQQTAGHLRRKIDAIEPRSTDHIVGNMAIHFQGLVNETKERTLYGINPNEIRPWKNEGIQNDDGSLGQEWLDAMDNIGFGVWRLLNWFQPRFCGTPRAGFNPANFWLPPDDFDPDESGRGRPSHWFMVDACNQAGVIPWLTIEHMATPKRAMLMGKFWGENCDNDVIIEASNETWNWYMPHVLHMHELAGSPRDHRETWPARAHDILSAFIEGWLLAGRDRSELKTAMMGSTADATWLRDCLEATPDGFWDLVGCAAYNRVRFPNDYVPTKDEVENEVEAGLPVLLEKIQANFDVAALYAPQAKFGFYEGQHISAIPGPRNADSWGRVCADYHGSEESIAAAREHIKQVRNRFNPWIYAHYGSWHPINLKDGTFGLGQEVGESYPTADSLQDAISGQV